jgi:glycerol-3-phosphate dehydrogenase
MKNIYGVLGAGSWGTAIVKILTEKKFFNKLVR